MPSPLLAFSTRLRRQGGMRAEEGGTAQYKRGEGGALPKEGGGGKSRSERERERERDVGESGQEVEAGEMRRFAFVRGATGMHSAQGMAHSISNFLAEKGGIKNSRKMIPRLQ